MLTTSRVVFSQQRLLRSILAISQARFCQVRANSPGPDSDESQQAERLKRYYIEQYQAKLNIVDNYRANIAQLEDERLKIQELRRASNNPLQRILNWLFNRDAQEQQTIQKLKKELQTNKYLSQQLWKATITEKNYTMYVLHKALGVNMIQVSRCLSRVDCSSFKDAQVREGIILTFKMLSVILYKYGFSYFKPSPKQKFNKSLHEEVQRVSAPQPKGTIVEVLEEGWMYNQEVLMQAKVVVSD